MAAYNRGFPVCARLTFLRYRTSVPRYTESRIQQLCKQACETTTKAESEIVLSELREAITDHLRLANDSLSLRVQAFNTPKPTESIGE